ncbi:hypothetical protein DV735_g4357, partial [Chaetothyriales sp. CBS 134920]
LLPEQDSKSDTVTTTTERSAVNRPPHSSLVGAARSTDFTVKPGRSPCLRTLGHAHSALPANASEPSIMSSAVGSAPPAHTTSDSLSARTQTIPAVPAVPAVNGHSASLDHSRRPPLTVTPTGATGFNPNAGVLGVSHNKPQVQFGSLGALPDGPALDSSSPPVAHQATVNLGVNQLGPRGSAPAPSPSPIPQPANPSGGRPPSSFSGQGNGVVFGQQPDQADPSVLARPLSQLQLGDSHMRRNSSQSVHSDVGGHALPTGPQGRSFVQPGRGRSGPGGKAGAPYAQSPARGQPFQYQGSPHLQSRTPMINTTPGGTPYMQPNQMMPIPGHNGVPYFQVMPPPPPFSPAPEPTRGQAGKRWTPRRGGRSGRSSRRGSTDHRAPRISRDPASDNYVPLPQSPPPALPESSEDVPAWLPVQSLLPITLPRDLIPDLSPASGNFEHWLTHNPQTAPDPSIQQHYNNQMGFYPQVGQYPGFPPSPRSGYQHSAYGAPPMQHTFSNQPQPQSMSRQSSQMSVPDRPASTLDQQHPHTPSLPTQQPHGVARTPAVTPAKSNFAPPKKTTVTIKNAAGEVAAKTDEEKRRAMQEAVKARIAAQDTKQEDAADKAGEVEKTNGTADAADKHEDAGDATKATTTASEDAPVSAEKQPAVVSEVEAAPAEPSEVEVVDPKVPEVKVDPAPSTTQEEEKPAKDENEDDEFERIAAEMAAAEEEEARREAEYAKKKAAEKEARLKKEREEAEEYERTMKKAEAEAEAAELAREKERETGGAEDEEKRRLFAELTGKKAGLGTPALVETPAAQTPGQSGTATPVSDVSMGPPLRSLGSKRGKAAELTLDTKKPVEPPEPSATLRALQSARKLQDISKVSYPSEIASPNPALNQNAPVHRGFKYDKTFLLQFQNIFKEKPTLDWDARIRDALGDGDASARPGGASARTPMNRTASNKMALPGQGFAMGTFGRPPLAPGSTSEQRFAASNAAAMRSGAIPGPFAQFSRGQMAPPMARTPSNNPMGGMPGSPRVGGSSRGGSRAESKRSKQNTKQSQEENKSMPLTAGMQIGTLHTSETGWKPHSAGQGSALGPVPGGGEGYLDPAMVQRKVKAALNKMTPNTFDKISDQILDIAAQSKSESDGRTLRQVIQLTFEKATDEAHWAPMYANFCRKMLETMSSDIKDENIKDKNGQVVAGGNLFRKYLLNRCQEEFERGWKVNLPPRAEGVTEEAAMLSDEYYVAAAAKRRGLGLVRFIGELFKLGMLTERIMHECVKKLVDYEGTPEEAEVESLTSLLRTIGKQLDNPESKAQQRMDVYFQRISATMELPDLPSRLKFLLMDIVDLRRKNWVSKDDNKGPKTIAEIRAEEEEKARQAELQRLASQSRGGRGGPPPLGRGDARSFSSGYGHVPPPDNSNRVNTDDLRRLGNRNARNAPGSLGPTLGPRTNSGRRGLGPGSLLSRGGEDSGASSRTGTPPAGREKEKKDGSSTNAFSALAALENEGPASPPSNPASPPSQKSQPDIARARSKSPGKATE